MTRSDIDGEGPDPLQLRLFSLEGGERKQEVIALVQAVDNFAGTSSGSASKLIVMANEDEIGAPFITDS